MKPKSELGFSVGGFSANVSYQPPFNRQAGCDRLALEITELSEVLLMMTTPAWKRVCLWAQARVAEYDRKIVDLCRNQKKNEYQIAVMTDARDMLDSFMQQINNRVSQLESKQQELETLKKGAAVPLSPTG